MRILRDTGLFFNRNMKESLRQPIWVFMSLITPLMYIALFAPILRNFGREPLETYEVLNSFVPGILSVLAFGCGMGAGWDVIFQLESGVIERLRVSLASRFSILMGQVLKDIVAFLVPALLVLTISAFFGFYVHIGGLAVLLFLLVLLTTIVSAWTSCMGLILRDMGTLAAVVTGLQLPLTLLSGVLLPLSFAPDWLRGLVHINPMYYTVEASRVLYRGDINNSETIVAFAIIIPLTAVALWWATRVYNKAVA